MGVIKNSEVRTTSRFLLWLNYPNKIRLKSSIFGGIITLGQNNWVDAMALILLTLGICLLLFNRHGLAILDQPYTEYSLEFKKTGLLYEY